MELIVGLGNPGLKYKKTRHNIGFMFIDSLMKEYNLDFKINKSFMGMVSRKTLEGKDVLFLKPITYMNLSGESVKKIVDFYKINVNDVLIIHDDMDLPVGKIRIRARGTSGGQKGMNNIISLLGTTEIKRIRIGIDKGEDSVEHVLGTFTKDEREKIENDMNKASYMINDYLTMSFENFMSKYNQNE